jgi:hypothetical protein
MFRIDNRYNRWEKEGLLSTEDACIYTFHKRSPQDTAAPHHIRKARLKGHNTTELDEDQSIEERYPAVKVTNGS